MDESQELNLRPYVSNSIDLSFHPLDIQPTVPTTLDHSPQIFSLKQQIIRNDRLIRDNLRLRRRIRYLKKQIKTSSQALQTSTQNFDKTLKEQILKEVKRLEKPNRKKVREIKRVSISRFADK